ncbi:MAG: SUMF1/EgtB/PvdO family nonheme iron enzyme, partial [Gemmatimonadota bacterium]|nr:SUMF1/EgtB/PvdO family nonheme iron enzyme [Gemmatimonadota bacterium]
PGGDFLMGNDMIADSGMVNATSAFERPAHMVHVDSFWMSTCEVTQKQYESVMMTNPSRIKVGFGLPVEQVLWYGAVVFCNKLSSASGLAKCYDLKSWECNFDANGFRLPTEAEWTYAACAGTKTYFSTGDDPGGLERTAWYKANSGKSPHPVGRKEPNAWGLYDMHGNVWEWCNDWFQKRYYRDSPFRNPYGPGEGTLRVVRGGGYTSDPAYCRSNSRAYCDPGRRRPDLGFRVVRRP